LTENKFITIQVRRGIAAIMVMLYHATRHYNLKGLNFIGNIFKNGYLGVDIFFVLSGFVITISSLKYFKNKNPLEFTIKRITRIFPSFWLYLLFPLTILYFIFPQFIYDKSAFEFSNYLKVIFLTFNHPTISQVTWTLSFELYFYFLFLMILINKSFKFLVVCVLIFSFLNLVGLPVSQNLYFKKYLFSPLVLEFFLGVLIAFILQKINTIKKYLQFVILFISLTLFLLSFYLEDYNYIHISKHNRFLYFGIASFLLILSSLLIEKFNKISFNKYLVSIGDASYVLYLIHSIILSFFNNSLILTGRFIILNNQITTVIICFLIVIISIIIHKYTEKPMIRFLNSKSKKWLLKSEKVISAI
jgi:peptidoglycan/LPS O-acetylase OafA/YrhL